MPGRAGLCNNFIGTSFEARHWLALDPCGLFGVTLSFASHIFAFFVILIHVISNSTFATLIFYLLYVPASFLGVASLFKAWTTDPGAVPMGARPLVRVRRASSSGEMMPSSSRTRGTRRCHKCNDNFKPPRAHHDSVTGRCIVKMDHFCPWVGNAIGALNHKFFVLFLLYTNITTILALFLLIVRAIHCGYVVHVEEDDKQPNSADGGGPMMKDISNDIMNNNEYNTTLHDPTRLLLTKPPDECQGSATFWMLLLLGMSIAYFLFTICMLVEQIEAIETNTGKIARMKLRVGTAGTELSRVTEDFNEMFGGESTSVSWHWFLPIRVRFPKGMHKVVLGYEWDEEFEAVPYQDSSEEEEHDLGLNVGEQDSSSEAIPELGASREVETGLVPDEKNMEDVSLKDTDASKPRVKKRTNSRGSDSRPPNSTNRNGSIV